MEGATTALTPVIIAMDTVTTLVGNVFTAMVGNQYIVVLMAAGLIGVGVRLFRKFKGAAR